MKSSAEAYDADVCLLLEGTFPYVRGGVSSWVNQIIRGMPQLRFHLIFLGSLRDHYEEPAYEIPDNVTQLDTYFLMEEKSGPIVVPDNDKLSKHQQKLFENIERHHDCMRDRRESLEPTVIDQMMTSLLQDGGLNKQQFQTSPYAWEMLRKKYLAAPIGQDFNHFFWTVRTMHSPLFKLAEIAKAPPRTRFYHSVSTGYAGFLGALLVQKTGRPLLLSEHGIYTKEREIDLAHVDWIPENANPFGVGLQGDMGYLRQLWIRFFHSLGRMTYNAADPIISLYDGNRQRQIIDGAQEQRTRVIPNGISLQDTPDLRRADSQQVPPVLGLIGRIVPIKDIKTFIRAMHRVCNEIPQAQGWLIGPVDEDPDYVADCKSLVRNLGLQDNVKFLGFQKVPEILPKLGLCVLTSISEGQPLVILEGFAAGVPSVTTDVGSCRELIEGGEKEDRAIGAAGKVVPIANPRAIAEAAIELLLDQKAWKAASAAALIRVRRYYDEKEMITRYKDLYQELATREHHAVSNKAQEPKWPVSDLN